MAGAFRPQQLAFPPALTNLRRAAWTQIRSRSFSMMTTYRAALMTLLAVGFLLRLLMLDAFPFREDEAIYSYWALHLTRVDALALSVWPDKPPIFLWLLGIVFALLGPSEAAARWLNIAASLLTIPVVAATARHLWGRRAALLAALFFALNPFAISFAPTAYTDPLLVLFGMLAFHAALTGRLFWAGLCLAAAIMTKQQGILYVPLVVGAAVGGWRMADGGWQLVGGRGTADDGRQTTDYALRTTHAFRIPHSAFRIRQFLLGLALVLVPILAWDSLRWAVAPSPWDLSVRNYGGFALAPLTDWPSRLVEWGSILWYLAGSGVVWAVILAVGGWRMAVGRWRMAVGGWRLADGGWRMADGGWRMADGGWRMADGGWRTTDDGRPTTHYALRTTHYALRPTPYALLITHYSLLTTPLVVRVPPLPPCHHHPNLGSVSAAVGADLCVGGRRGDQLGDRAAAGAAFSGGRRRADGDLVTAPGVDRGRGRFPDWGRSRRLCRIGRDGRLAGRARAGEERPLPSKFGMALPLLLFRR